ncbi:branched-chain amino acid dehydrogenase [Vagococcus penaei]|uniref:Branched-chain amino acid dehydrogenase n=1 Tax=Vagococcus penaei TaxID=633807 RepID=A0A1Q2D5R7_9ENTE|nr:3-oxoacid CoA-transferase subunit A [Vagococcus penaei]AQP53597.1 branched-chain amino acid dehydrogenase [Vagococcus penaei]RSU07541.1 branched-chain amino acid dehydrogenase [Vagococcus penaei]
MNKTKTVDEAIDLIKPDSSIMISGFLGVGSPIRLIDKLAEHKEINDLTLIMSVASYPGKIHDIESLFINKQVKKYIGAHVGTSRELSRQYLNNEVEIEFCPMGTLAERIHAGGAGLGAVVTPVGVGTQQEEDHDVMEIDGKKYLVYRPLKADYALIRGFRADKEGNIQSRGTSKSAVLQMALAGKTVIAEVNEIVEVGDIAPDDVEVPGPLVDYIVQGDTLVEAKEYFNELWSSTNQLKVEVE